ncbi:MAG: hypothetical protein HQK97_07065 [Nitrospirae bacterium]|nr:hypothetical protein [Nitrospirota bacterium]
MGKRLILPVLLIVLAVFLVQNIAAAGPLFRWIDKDGNSHVTDYPPPNEEETETKEQDKPQTTQPETKAKPEPPSAAATPSPKPKKATPSPSPKPTPKPEQPATPKPEQPATPKPSAAATPGPQKTAEPPVVNATPAPAQPSATATPRPTLRPLPKPIPKPAMPLKKQAFPGNLPIDAKTLPLIFVGILCLAALSYVLYTYFLYKIAVRLDVPMPWMAWIPVLNLYTKVQAADKPLWWIVIIFFVPILEVVPWMDICERLGINRKYGLLSLGLLVGPLIMIAGAVVAPLFHASFAIVIIAALVLFLLANIVVVAQPAICYRASNKVWGPESSSNMSPDSSTPDYDHDTMPLGQPDYGDEAGMVSAGAAAAGAAIGAGIIAAAEADAHEYKNTDDEETVGIALQADHDEFTLEENVYEDAGIKFDEDQSAPDSEAITIDPDALTIDSEALTVGADAASAKPQFISDDDIPVDYAKDASTNEGIDFKLDEFSLDEEPGKDPAPDYAKDSVIVNVEEHDGIDFKIDDLNLDGEFELDTVSSQPGQQRQHDEDYKFDLDAIDISLAEADETKIQPNVEVQPEISEFKFDLDDLPASDSDTRDLADIKLHQDADIQFETEAPHEHSEFTLELDTDSDSHIKDLDEKDSGIASVELDTYSKADGLMSATVETEEEQHPLPAEYSLDIAGESPQDLPEIEFVTDNSAEPVFNIPSEYSLELDHPVEDESGNLKIDDSDFKSLSALVDLELAQEAGASSEYDMSEELKDNAPISATAPLRRDSEITPEPKPKKEAKAKKDSIADIPEPMTDIASDVPGPKPKKETKAKKEAISDMPDAATQTPADLPEAKPKKGTKAKKEAIFEVPQALVEAPIVGLKAKLRKSPKPKAEPEPEVEIVPLKPKVPDKPHNEWTLEDILVAGLSLEKEEPPESGATHGDAHTEDN